MNFQLVFVAILLGAAQALESYDGYKVIEMNLKTDEEMKFVFQMSERYQADIWKGPSKVIETHLMLSPESFDGFTESLTKYEIRYKIIINNVQKEIDEETRVNDNTRFMKMFSTTRPRINDNFAEYEEIMYWIDYLTEQYSFVSSGSYGKSYEDRDLRYVKISTGKNRKSVLVEGGIHSREWLATATVTYMIEKMISDIETNNSRIVSMLSKFDVYFIPVFNPDGNIYSHLRGNRLWRKNRRIFYLGDRTCFGVDLNRNFDAQFGVAGTSSNPCDEIYKGPTPFSEPETKYFSEFVKKLGSNLSLFFSLHAYAQFWFVPYGFGYSRPADDYELRRVANIGNQALYEVNRERFYVGSPPELLYAAAGGSFDWVKMKTNVKYAYTLELRPSRYSVRGSAGFLAPVSDISKSGEEVYAGFIATIQAMSL